jgi:hypothetical protein
MTTSGGEGTYDAIAAAVRPRASIGWATRPLLALAVFINYVDRGNPRPRPAR